MESADGSAVGEMLCETPHTFLKSSIWNLLHMIPMTC